ncbi:15780_t:CDS:2, partial [Racocetra persica]
MAKRVVFLALDRLGLYVKNNKELQNFWMFFTLGASSFQADALDPSDSAQNWGAILHRVGKDRLVFNNGNVNKNIFFNENSPYPSIPKMILKDDENTKIAFYWLQLSYYLLKNSIYDHATVSQVKKYILNPKNKDTKLLFVHLTDVDKHRHQHEFGSVAYLNQVKVMDSQIGEIFNSVKQAG